LPEKKVNSEMDVSRFAFGVWRFAFREEERKALLAMSAMTALSALSLALQLCGLRDQGVSFRHADSPL
jgi:hypothetical protein